MLTLTLEALLDEAVEQRAAVVAESEPFIVMYNKTVRHV